MSLHSLMGGYRKIVFFFLVHHRSWNIPPLRKKNMLVIVWLSEAAKQEFFWVWGADVYKSERQESGHPLLSTGWIQELPPAGE